MCAQSVACGCCPSDFTPPTRHGLGHQIPSLLGDTGLSIHDQFGIRVRMLWMGGWDDFPAWPLWLQAGDLVSFDTVLHVGPHGPVPRTGG
eukprot:2103054-Alexandrium_andersonii.AAC.1